MNGMEMDDLKDTKNKSKKGGKNKSKHIKQVKLSTPEKAQD